MANTIYSLFPLSQIKSEHVTIYPCYVEFKAAIQNGQYVFENNAAEFGKLLQGQTGVIAGVSISANCTDAEFTTAIESPLMLRVIHGENKTTVNAAPFPFTAFEQVENFELDWVITGATMKQEEPFLLDVTGTVNQIPGMTNNELILRVSFNYMRVASKYFFKG